MNASSLSQLEMIKSEALRLGFDAVGVADADFNDSARLSRFIEAGRHGEMTWMETRQRERASPRALWPDANSVIMLGMNYGPDHDPTTVLGAPSRGAISVYAQNKDYHDVVKKRLKQLGRWMATEFSCALKVFVDTAPVMEKPLAARAGIGWQGKHTNLVSREKGSWLFLGAIFTDLHLAPDPPEIDHCGSCDACLSACPTDAFPAPYQLDARRCISYLTIEYAGPIPHEFREQIGNRIYGCDDCLAACPWNKFAQRASEAAFHARTALKAPKLEDLAQLDDAGFRALFSGSPIKRIKRDRFVRNVLIAIGNSGDRRLAESALPHTQDPAAIVRGAAVWALSKLIKPNAFAALAARALNSENDASVQAEWRGGGDKKGD